MSSPWAHTLAGTYTPTHIHTHTRGEAGELSSPPGHGSSRPRVQKFRAAGFLEPQSRQGLPRCLLPFFQTLSDHLQHFSKREVYMESGLRKTGENSPNSPGSGPDTTGSPCMQYRAPCGLQGSVPTWGPGDGCKERSDPQETASWPGWGALSCQDSAHGGPTPGTWQGLWPFLHCCRFSSGGLLLSKCPQIGRAHV